MTNQNKEAHNTANNQSDQNPAIGVGNGLIGGASSIENNSSQSNSNQNLVSFPTPNFLKRPKPLISDYEARKPDRENPRSRFGKVDFPLFDGSGNVKIWICQANQYFAINRTAEEDKSQTASLYL